MTGFLFYLVTFLLVALAGYLAHRLLFTHTPGDSITKVEWVIGMVVCGLLILPLTAWAGGSIARASQATKYEWWGGLEDTTHVKTINCERNGSCRHTFDCNKHIVMVTKTRRVSDGTETYRDANGNTKTRTKYRTETYQEPEVRYDSCPYVKQEFTYTVKDTLGDTHTFAFHWFPEHPSDKRWKGHGHNDPRYGWGMPKLPNGVKKGIPADWAAVKARVDAGNPGGVQKRMKYKDYLLASDKHILQKYSPDIEEYKKAGLMPTPTKDKVGYYGSRKAYFPKLKVADAEKFQFELLRLNGHLGQERQGDMHLVAVNADAVKGKDRYALALEAYWRSPEMEKNPAAKNSVTLVMGVKDGKVAWSRAFTAMPMGNEALVQKLTHVEGEDFTLEALFGEKRTGRLYQELFSDTYGFARIEMANYDHLYDTVEIGAGARMLIALVGFLLSLGIWGILFAVETPLGMGQDRTPKYRPSGYGRTSKRF